MDAARFDAFAVEMLERLPAIAHGHAQVELRPEHLLLACLRGRGPEAELLLQLHLPPDGLEAAVEAVVASLPAGAGNKPWMNEALRDALARADMLAVRLNSPQVGVEHLLASLADAGVPNGAQSLLGRVEVTKGAVLRAVGALRGEPAAGAGQTPGSFGMSAVEADLDDLAHRIRELTAERDAAASQPAPSSGGRLAELERALLSLRGEYGEFRGALARMSGFMAEVIELTLRRER